MDKVLSNFVLVHCTVKLLKVKNVQEERKTKKQIINKRIPQYNYHKVYLLRILIMEILLKAKLINKDWVIN